MSYQDLIYGVEDGIATITLNRPARMNALSHDLEAELHRAFDEADADRAVRVIILTGSGTAFCAGFDQGPNKSGRRNSDPTGRSIAEFLEDCHRRHGKRVADWAHMWRLAADITIASESAVFAQPEVRHISASSYLLTALCGWKVANRWALTGDHFDAQEALRIGMVNEVVPHDRLMEAALALARRIALVPEPSVRLNKAIAMQGIQAAGLYAALLVEGTLGTLAQASHNEFREKLFEVHRTQGVKAYLDMRDGPFQPEPMGPRAKKAGKKNPT
jgi:enoyl-CoA hydratase/carnithine racemase